MSVNSVYLVWVFFFWDVLAGYSQPCVTDPRRAAAGPGCGREGGGWPGWGVDQDRSRRVTRMGCGNGQGGLG